MRKLLLPLILLIAQMGFSQNQTTLSPEKTQIIERLKLIENSYINKLDFDERRKAIQLMNEILARLQTIGEAPLPVTSPQPALINPIMGDTAFKNLLSQVNSENFDSEKTKLITAVINRGFISSEQLSQLIATYTWDNDRQACIENVYKNVLDKGNISMVLQYFQSSITKGKVLDYIKNYHE